MKTKRFLSICLAMLLVCVCLFVTQAAAAEKTPTLSLEKVQGEVNSTLQIRLRLSDNPGIVALLVKVQYDHSVMELTNAVNGEIIPDEMAIFNPDFTSAEYTMTWLDALTHTNYTANGTLATLTFRILDTAAVGTSAVTLTYDPGSTFGTDLGLVECALVPGSVTVVRPIKSVTGVSLPAELRMACGETAKLTAEVYPADATDPTVSWSSSDALIVTVDDSGDLTALRAGTAWITVITRDGGKIAECVVTVTEPVIPVTDVTLSQTSLTMNYKSAARLTATVSPENATNAAVTWSSDNTDVVTVDDDGNLTTHRAGTANITVTTQDGGKTAACCVTVQYTFLQKIIIYLLFGFLWYIG